MDAGVTNVGKAKPDYIGTLYFSAAAMFCMNELIYGTKYSSTAAIAPLFFTVLTSAVIFFIAGAYSLLSSYVWYLSKPALLGAGMTVVGLFSYFFGWGGNNASTVLMIAGASLFLLATLYRVMKAPKTEFDKERTRTSNLENFFLLSAVGAYVLYLMYTSVEPTERQELFSAISLALFAVTFIWIFVFTFPLNVANQGLRSFITEWKTRAFKVGVAPGLVGLLTVAGSAFLYYNTIERGVMPERMGRFLVIRFALYWVVFAAALVLALYCARGFAAIVFQKRKRLDEPYDRKDRSFADRSKGIFACILIAIPAAVILPPVISATIVGIPTIQKKLFAFFLAYLALAVSSLMNLDLSLKLGRIRSGY